jgi:hypothetical protein
MAARDPVDVFSNVAVSSTTTFKSKPTVPSGDGDVGYCIDVTGTPTGTLTIEVSSAKDQEIAADPDAGFQTYTQSSFGASLSIVGPVSHNIKLTNMRGFKRVRLKYVNATSSGNLKAMALAD